MTSESNDNFIKNLAVSRLPPYLRLKLFDRKKKKKSCVFV